MSVENRLAVEQLAVLAPGDAVVIETGAEPASRGTPQAASSAPTGRASLSAFSARVAPPTSSNAFAGTEAASAAGCEGSSSMAMWAGRFSKRPSAVLST
ncbi:hypothetical protein ACI798_01315 [Geodermatophilus sp. SYSU D01045]